MIISNETITDISLSASGIIAICLLITGLMYFPYHLEVVYGCEKIVEYPNGFPWIPYEKIDCGFTKTGIVSIIGLFVISILQFCLLHAIIQYSLFAVRSKFVKRDN